MLLQELAGDLPLGAVQFPGQATAGTAYEQAVFVAPFRCQVQAAAWIPSAAVTGVASNFFTVNVRNRGAAGAGTAVPAALAFSNGTNASAQVPVALTLSGTAADLVLAAGDVLTAEKAVTGTGLAMPPGLIVVRVRGF